MTDLQELLEPDAGGAADFDGGPYREQPALKAMSLAADRGLSPVTNGWELRWAR
ncbi:hypothetical protein ABZT02_11660 [Streptomyces sp. NPDC005402]|uniref:hypothetical protein n=1 Tax=Streptomyces sp. NPDC005402 TaxID=3155338 RepID=UPI0033B7A235